MEPIETAELFMALRDYSVEEKKELERGVDFTILDEKTNDKVLLRVITDPESKSGIIGVDGVKNMIEKMNNKKYDRGVIISNRFSEAAKKESERENIQVISKRLTPRFQPDKVYLSIQGYVERLCKMNCGQIPEKEELCKGYSDRQYSCDVRRISDNASFHFHNGWINLLKNDLIKLLDVFDNFINKEENISH